MNKKLQILNVRVSAINMEKALRTMGEWIDQGQRQYVTVTPAHAIMDCYRHPELRPIFNASGMTTPDGMAVVWLLRLMGEKQVSRVYGPDLVLAACERSLQTGWAHYFYGGAPGVAEKLAGRLCERYPGLRVVGMAAPPFRPLTPEEDEADCRRINASGADIVWVGLGSPRQEVWMSEHLGRLNVPVMVGVGAAFEFLSGTKSQAPRWMQRSGLEWLYRLISEPRRLWRRYARYPLFALLATAQLLGLRRFSD